MRRHRARTILGGLALVMTCLFVLPSQTQATPPGGVVGTPLVRGSFTDDVGVKFKLSYGDRTIVADAKDASQVALQSFTFAPGGSTGWHSHPGPVVVLVMSGELTYYQGSGPCVGRVYPAGTAFLDSGTGAPTFARNESAGTTQTSVVYFGVPEGASPRIDEPAPGNCDF